MTSSIGEYRGAERKSASHHDPLPVKPLATHRRRSGQTITRLPAGSAGKGATHTAPEHQE